MAEPVDDGTREGDQQDSRRRRGLGFLGLRPGEPGPGESGPGESGPGEPGDESGPAASAAGDKTEPLPASVSLTVSEPPPGRPRPRSGRWAIILGAVAALLWIYAWAAYLEPVWRDPAGLAPRDAALLVNFLIVLPVLGWFAIGYIARGRHLSALTDALVRHLGQFSDTVDGKGNAARDLVAALERQTDRLADRGRLITGLTDRLRVEIADQQRAVRNLAAEIDGQAKTALSVLGRQVAEMDRVAETNSERMREQAGALQALVERTGGDAEALLDSIEQRTRAFEAAADHANRHADGVTARLDGAAAAIEAGMARTGAGADELAERLAALATGIEQHAALLEDASSRQVEWMQKVGTSLTDQRDVLAEGARLIATQAERSRAGLTGLAEDLGRAAEGLGASAEGAEQRLTELGARIAAEQAGMEQAGAGISERLTGIGRSVAVATGTIAELERRLPSVAESLERQDSALSDMLARTVEAGERLVAALGQQRSQFEAGEQMAAERLEAGNRGAAASAIELERLASMASGAFATLTELEGRIAEGGGTMGSQIEGLLARLSDLSARLAEAGTSTAQVADEADRKLGNLGERLMIEGTRASRAADGATERLEALVTALPDRIAGIEAAGIGVLERIEAAARAASGEAEVTRQALGTLSNDLESVGARLIELRELAGAQGGNVAAELTALLAEATSAANELDEIVVGWRAQSAEIVGAAESAAARLENAGTGFSSQSELLLGAATEAAARLDAAATSVPEQVERVRAIGSEVVAQVAAEADLAAQKADGARDRLATVARALAQLRGVADEISERMEETGRRALAQGEALDAVAARGDAAATALGQLVDSLPERFGAVATAGQDALMLFESGAERIGQQGESVRLGLAQAAGDLQDLAAGLDGTLDRVEAARHGFAAAGEAMESAAGAAADRIVLAADRLKAEVGAIDALSEAGSMRLAETAERIVVRASEFAGAIDEAAGRIGDAAALLPDRLAAVETGGREVADRLATEAAQAAEHGQAIRNALTLLATDLVRLNGQLAQAGDTFVQGRARFAGEIAEGAEHLEEAAGKLSETAERAGERLDALGEAAASTDARLAALIGGLPLQLDQLAQAGAQASARLDQLSGKVNDRESDLGVLAQSTELLVERVDAAVENFRSQADTLRQIAEETRVALDAALTIPEPTATGGSWYPKAAAEGEPEPVQDSFLDDAAAVLVELEDLASDIAKPLLKAKPERGTAPRRIVEGWTQQTTLEVRLRHGEDRQFRRLLDRYIERFESLFAQQRRHGRPNVLDQVLLSSELGRLYVQLARAIGRL